MTSGTLTLTGKRFNTGSSCSVSITNQITGKVNTITSGAGNCTATSITITVPSLEAGYYLVRARTDPIG